MSELVLSLRDEISAEGDCYLSLDDFLKYARNGILDFKVYPFKRTVVTIMGRESTRTFAKGEQICLVTKTSTEFDAIFKGTGRLAYAETQISRIRVVAATPDSDDNPHEFLVVVRNGEDLVYVEDVFPYAWGGLRTKNVFPRYYWIEVNRLIKMSNSFVIPGIPTASTVSAYVEDEENDKISQDVARELYLVEELGRCSDEITELEIEKMISQSESKKLRNKYKIMQKENEALRREVMRLEEERAQLMKSTTTEVRRIRTQQRVDQLQGPIAANRDREFALSSSSTSSASSSSSSFRLARRLHGDDDGNGGTGDDGRPAKLAKMRKVSPDKEEK